MATCDILQSFHFIIIFKFFGLVYAPQIFIVYIYMKLFTYLLLFSFFKEAQEAVDYMSEEDVVEKVHLETYITEKKPNYVKVMEG